MLDRLNTFIRGNGGSENLRRKVAQATSRLPSMERERERSLDRLATRIVWVLGSGRTGSTWVTRMLSDSGPHEMWNEPLVGSLFGNFHHDRASHRRGVDYILSEKYSGVWLPLVRSFVLENALVRYPEVAEPGCEAHLFIKEPNGSLGSTLMMRALPESRMLLLVRDPRDSIASRVDSQREGSWNTSDQTPGRRYKPLKEARVNAILYERGMSNALEAFGLHHGFKSFVSYEELLDDSLGSMRRVVSELDLSTDEASLARSVEKHSWENIPEDQKGEGKKFRKGESGSWREDLSPEQVEVVERLTGHLMDEFGYARSV